MWTNKQTNKQTSTAICCHIHTQTLKHKLFPIWVIYQWGVMAAADRLQMPATHGMFSCLQTSALLANHSLRMGSRCLQNLWLSLERGRVVVTSGRVFHSLWRENAEVSPNMCQNPALFCVSFGSYSNILWDIM